MRDTEIGMSSEQCERIFQSFSQADSSTTRKCGTDLGLAISKRLVEMMGRICGQSVLGQGSTRSLEAPSKAFSDSW
ncbi:ATP-binding protein [Pseudomonas alkylphenolica]